MQPLYFILLLCLFSGAAGGGGSENGAGGGGGGPDAALQPEDDARTLGSGSGAGSVSGGSEKDHLTVAPGGPLGITMPTLEALEPDSTNLAARNG